MHFVSNYCSIQKGGGQKSIFPFAFLELHLVPPALSQFVSIDFHYYLFQASTLSPNMVR